MKLQELFESESEDPEKFKEALAAHAKDVVKRYSKPSDKSFSMKMEILKKEGHTLSVVEETLSVDKVEFFSDYHFGSSDKGPKKYLDPDNHNKFYSTEGSTQKNFGVRFVLSNGEIVNLGCSTDSSGDSKFVSVPFMMSIGEKNREYLPKPLDRKIVKRFKSDLSNICEATLLGYSDYQQLIIKKAGL